MENVLITGASSGVGKSIVTHLSDEYHVIAVARRIERMEEQFSKFNTISPHQIDLADTEETKATVDGLLDQYGDISYVINNAGVNLGASIQDVDEADLLYSMRVNAIAPTIILQRMLPAMEGRGFGRVINVTSGAPLNCPVNSSPYSSSKAALNVLTVTAANEFEDTNIKINLMSPGPCRTEMAPDGPLDPSACHPTVEYLLSLDESGPTGRFFWLGYEVPLFPDLGDLRWEEGVGSEELTEVV
jgi:NAD(P)-dependent dehydrogenase (short-subunit alcohol dehydrogenase family)